MIVEFSDIIFTYGPFAKPFLNIALESDIDPVWKKFFRAMSYEWKYRHESALNELERGLTLLEKKDKDFSFFYRKRKTELYLFQAYKLLILHKESKKETIDLIKKLRKNYGKVPEFARKLVMPVLANCYFSESHPGSSKPRWWSGEYEKDPVSNTPILLAKARKAIKDRKLTEVISFYKKAFKIAESIPQPMIMIDALNDISWYLRARHKSLAFDFAKKAMYLSGYYKENIRYNFYALDTFLECASDSKTASPKLLRDSLSLMLLCKNEIGDGFKKWEEKIETVEFDPSASSYEITRELRDYLAEHVHGKRETAKLAGISRNSVANIVNGNTKAVKGQTLRRITSALDVNFDSDMPGQIVNEFYKLSVKDGFSKAVAKLKALSAEEGLEIIMTAYMSCEDRRHFLKHLSRKGIFSRIVALYAKDPSEFAEAMARRHETRKFVSDLFDAHPFIEGKKTLAMKFVNGLGERARKKFFQVYVRLEEDKKTIVDEFVRNYVRYDMKWDMELKPPDGLKRYVETFNLKVNPSVLSYYFFDSHRKRERLLDVFVAFGSAAK